MQAYAFRVGYFLQFFCTPICSLPSVLHDVTLIPLHLQTLIFCDMFSYKALRYGLLLHFVASSPVSSNIPLPASHTRQVSPTVQNNRHDYDFLYLHLYMLK